MWWIRLEKISREIIMFELPITTCMNKGNTYWECYSEAVKTLVGIDTPEAHKTWERASFIYASVANYFIRQQVPDVPKTFFKIKQWVGDNWYKYALVFEDSLPTTYNLKLKKIYRNTGLGNFAYATTRVIDSPHLFFSMGFANAKEYFAWGAFVLAWAGKLNEDSSLLQKADDYLSKFFTRPNDVPQSLWRTPALTNKERAKKFASELQSFAEQRFLSDIQPFIYGSGVSGVRAFTTTILRDSEDTITLAVETAGWKKEEEFDWTKVALAVVVGYGAFKYITR